MKVHENNTFHIYFSHILFTYTFHIYFSHILFTYTFTYTFHIYFSYTFHIYFSHILFTYTFHIYFSHILFTYSFLPFFCPFLKFALKPVVRYFSTPKKIYICKLLILEHASAEKLFKSIFGSCNWQHNLRHYRSFSG